MLRLVNINQEIYPLWDRFVEGHPLSSIYHTSSWMILLEEVFGYKQKGSILLNQDQIVGGMPLFEVRGFLQKRLVSSPFRDRGGLLVSQGIDPMPLLEKAVFLFASQSFDYLLIKEEFPWESSQIRRLGFIENTSWVTTTVELTLKREDYWQALGNNAQGPIKQAKRENVAVRFADNIKDIEMFYDIFLGNRKNLGIPSFPKKFFMVMWNRMFLNGKAKLLMAEKEGRVLAGMILFLYKDRVIDAYAASHNRYLALRPNDLLVWTAIEWALTSGYRIFDFGADSYLQKNLLAFKAKWKGEHKSMHHYLLVKGKDDSYGMDSSEKRYETLRKITSRLPRFIFRICSELTVARFG